MTFRVTLFVNQGIGIETARALAKAKAHVIITARDTVKGAEVVEDLKKTTDNNNVEMMQLELNSLDAVRNFVDRFRARGLPINILICTFNKTSSRIMKMHL